MKKRNEKKETKEQDGRITEIDKAVDCSDCRDHGNVDMIINFGSNRSVDNLDFKGTLYRVQCRRCKVTTEAWYTKDMAAVLAWNSLQQTKQSNKAL